MDGIERGMNPVAMTIISPRKEYWPSRGSNQRPPVLKSATLPTEQWGSFYRSIELYMKLKVFAVENFYVAKNDGFYLSMDRNNVHKSNFSLGLQKWDFVVKG